MKTSLRQRVLIAVGISAGLLASFNLFGQNSEANPAAQYTINSQSDYTNAVESIHELAIKLYESHVKYPSLSYSHVYNQDGSLMGFTVSGVPHSSEADNISVALMQLELLGEAVNKMDVAYLPDTDQKLTSRVTKKKAMQNTAEQEHAVLASAHPYEYGSTNR
jgi:hypothetical protein